MTYAEHPPNPYTQDEVTGSRPVYLCDIDGTLTARSEEIDEDPRSRGIHDYHRVGEDQYHRANIMTVALLQQSGAKIIFVTGRPESCRKDSMEWINASGTPLRTDKDHPLYMRNNGDRRPDTIVKREIFDLFIRPFGYWIVGVFDDRNRVVFSTWRNQLGLNVFHVAWHNF